MSVFAGVHMPSLDGVTGWLNSEPLGPAELRGHVVLVNFWTLTCINWLRQEPYVRAWSRGYKDDGLIVIGVHTPEFSFEHDLDLVRRATEERGIDYPVAQDNDYGIWTAFGNNYWPALYFVDASGRLRHHHFGEGAYARSESMIQKLLADGGANVANRQLVAVQGSGIEADADWGSLRSPENYLGYGRTDGFASPGGAAIEKRRVYAVPSRLMLNHWALAGDWTVRQRKTVLNQPNGRIVYRFHARDLHLVMGPATRDASVRFRVLVDGQPPGAAHGIDVDAQGNGVASEQRLYQLIRQPRPIVDRQFEIQFLEPGIEAFSLTFG